MNKKHVIIIGCGFAGLGCAKKLVEHDDVHITLIDKNNYHQFQPLLYQLATSELGSGQIATSIRELIKNRSNGDFKMAEVTSIDPHTLTVSTKTGETYQGDFLVLATGSQENFFSTPGASEYSFPLYSLDDAERLRSRILTVFEDVDRNPELVDKGGLNFVIVGAGPTGTEMAGALSDMINDVMPREYTDLNIKAARIYLINHANTVLGGFSEKSQKYAMKVLEKRGVQLRLGLSVKEVKSGSVLLSDGTRIPSHTVIWAGGLKAAEMANHSGLPQGVGQRINVQPDLSVEGFPKIYALGDCANIPTSTGKFFPQLGSVAQQCGYWAAQNILAQISEEPTQPFHYHDKGIMAMIGRNAAVAEVGKNHHEIEGMVAFAAWLGVHVALMPYNWQRVETFIGWAWEYFSKTQALQISDLPDAMQINWQEDEKSTTSKKTNDLDK
jgi:NADH:ubiquinone reductase (H+-translocating)